MRLPCSFHAQYGSSFSFYLSLMRRPPPHPSLDRERSSNHQSVCSSCGLRQHHAGLSVFPDGTSVRSGCPHTSILTPLIFTCYRANWKMHKSLKRPHRSQSLRLWNWLCFPSAGASVSVRSLFVWGFFWGGVIAGSAPTQPRRKGLLGIHHRPSSNEKLGPIEIWVKRQINWWITEFEEVWGGGGGGGGPASSSGSRFWNTRMNSSDVTSWQQAGVLHHGLG